RSDRWSASVRMTVVFPTPGRPVTRSTAPLGRWPAPDTHAIVPHELKSVGSDAGDEPSARTVRSRHRTARRPRVPAGLPLVLRRAIAHREHPSAVAPGSSLPEPHHQMAHPDLCDGILIR